MKRLGLPTIVAIAVIAVGAVQLVDGAISTGISFDEKLHVERTYGWLTYGWFVPEPEIAGGIPDPSKGSSPFVYGPAYSALAHAVNVELGNEPIGNVSFSTDAYAVRHLVVAALAALAAAMAGALVWFLTRSWRFGLWATAALLAIPPWLGHGFFNPKDVAAASGYTLATVGLALAIGPGPPSRRRLIAVSALLAGGIFIGVGTRLALWAPVLAGFVVYAALRVGQRWRGRIEEGWTRDGAVFVGGALGVAAVAAVYPKAVETPRTLLTQAISASADYPTETTTLTAGHLLPSHPPWWYLPAWIGAGTPLLIGALAILGALLALAALGRLRESGPGSFWGDRRLGLIPVLQQAAMLPFLAIVGGTTMYDGSRQHLYVFPALAILAGVGAQHAWRWARTRQSRAWPTVAAAALSLALAVPMLEQVLLFPYNYAYVNPIAGIGGVNGRWETDYWYTSNREAVRRVPRGVRLRCSDRLEIPLQPDLYPVIGDCREYPFDDERGDDANPVVEGNRGPWVVSWARGGNEPPPWCEDADNVTRWLRGEEVVMGYVLRCDPKQTRASEGG